MESGGRFATMRMEARLLWGMIGLGAGLLGCGGSKIQGVPPSLQIAPANLDFGVVALGKSSTQTLTLSAGTAKAVQVNSVSLLDDGDGSSAAFALGTVPSEVDSSQPATLAITYAPTQARTQQATLTIASTDANHPTQQVALKGSGAQPQIEVSLECTGCSAALAQDGGLGIDFGTVPTGFDAGGIWPEALISNQGGEPANLTSITLVPDGGPFYLPTVPSLPQPFPAGESRPLPLESTSRPAPIPRRSADRSCWGLTTPSGLR